MCGIHVRDREALLAEKRLQIACFGECCCLGEFVAMMPAALACSQREQGKHA
jgi:hypothetical protein